MPVEIHSEILSFDLHGVSGDVPDRNYAKAAFKLMEGLWPVVKEKGIRNTGINFWVYDGPTRISTCVELLDNDHADLFEHIPVRFERYAYYKHIGPYDRLADAYRSIDREIAVRSLTRSGLSVEKYGHWTDDTNKLETEIFVGLG